jgi:site-specific DNA recombinase
MNQATAAEMPIRTRVATYERVSSEDQRLRETIKTQTEEIARRLAMNPALELVDRYVDDGVSGTIPMAERPAGRRLLADAAQGRFDEVWVYSVDRLGRGWADPAVVWEHLERVGVKICSLNEEVSDRFVYHVMAGLAAKKRTDFLRVTRDGMDRAAREGRYTGGVVALGYRVEGKRPQARLVSDDTVLWGDLTAADVVRKIYHHLAIDKWSCRRIADEFNALGIPTAAERPGQGNRWQKTQGIWRPGRIRNLVVNPVYRGELFYRRRIDPKKQPVRLRGIISAQAPELALVSDEVWQAAQATLAENRLCSKHEKHVYLLRSVMVCGCCGLTFVGTHAHGDVWFRCNGYLTDRGPIEGRCPSKAVKGATIEPQVWADIETFLRNPGAILHELEQEAGKDTAEVAAREHRDSLHAALEENTLQRSRLLDLAQSGFLEKDELKGRLDDLAEQRKALEERLKALEPVADAALDPEGLVTLTRLHRRFDEGLTDEERSEIVRILVRRIVIHTEIGADGKKRVRAVVEYRFPNPAERDVCVVSSSTVTPASRNYTFLHRIVDLPSGRQKHQKA